MAASRYPANGSGHVLLNRSRSGDRVLLEDRSIWRIDPGERTRTGRWPQWTRVRVEPAGGNGWWLVAEVLGQRERVMAVYLGTLPHADAPGPATVPATPPSEFGEPEA